MNTDWIDISGRSIGILSLSYATLLLQVVPAEKFLHIRCSEWYQFEKGIGLKGIIANLLIKDTIMHNGAE